MSVPVPLVYLVAGEPSGDLLGARLMAALKAETGGRIAFAGVGGEAMAAEGLESLFDIADVAVMGFFEVLPRVPLVLRRVRQTVADVVARRPAVLVTIDSWGFTGRVNDGVRAAGLGLPQIHYVAPMVWAWKEKRARGMVGRIDHLMTLLPFEPSYFTRVGLPATCVGHPVVEGGVAAGDGAAFRARQGIPPEAPLLCLLPGSRRGEAQRLLPVFAATLALLAPRHPGLRVVVPTVATVAELVVTAAGTWPAPATVVRGADKADAFAAADAALAASGTVTLELAAAGVPMVVTYRVAALSAWLFRRMVKVPHVSLVNIVMERAVVPELLQEDCRADRLAAAVAALLADAEARAAQRAGLAEALARLGRGGPPPATRAARLVLEAIAGTR